MSSSDKDSEIQTPFKQREEARKLKVLLETTPGLKRRKLGDVIGTIKNSPNDSRQFLQELNSALSSQRGTNLQDKLLDAEESNEALSLSQTVFSQIRDPKEIYGRVKQDVDESLVITDSAVPSEFQEEIQEDLPFQDDLQESSDNLAQNTPPHNTPPQYDSNIDADNEQNIEINSSHEIDIDNEQDIESEHNDSVPSNVYYVDENAVDDITYPDIVVDIPDLQGIDIPENIWKVLTSFLKQLFIDFNGFGEDMANDRSRVLEILSQYNADKKRANSMLFEIACRYLPLEDCNSLELELFSNVA